MSDRAIKMYDEQVDRDKIADKLSACLNWHEKRTTEKSTNGSQWQRGRGCGKGGKGVSPAKQVWARIATCYFCYAYGHTGSDHDVKWPLTTELDKRYNLGHKWHGCAVN